jgi:hypothetical protein
MKIIHLTPYDFTVKRYPQGESILFICDTSESSFTAILPDASAIRDNQFYFQKNSANNTLYLATQFGQSINGVAQISLQWQYHTVMLVSDLANYRLLSGVVAELPSTWPFGPYWRFRPTGNDLYIEKDPSFGADPNGWTPYDRMRMVD